MTAALPSPACAECGATLAPGRACRDYFHDLLALEARVPGGAGEEPHFLAVAAYNLQHPAGFVPAALLGLHRTLAEVLAGRATVADARRRARAAADGATRVRRRADATLSEAELALLRAWPTRWEWTVRDVDGMEPERYVERVRLWAAAVAAELEPCLAAPAGPLRDGVIRRAGGPPLTARRAASGS